MERNKQVWREKASAAQERMDALVAQEAEGEPLSAEEQAEFTQCKADFDAAKAAIDRINIADATAASQGRPTDNLVVTDTLVGREATGRQLGVRRELPEMFKPLDQRRSVKETADRLNMSVDEVANERHTRIEMVGYDFLKRLEVNGRTMDPGSLSHPMVESASKGFKNVLVSGTAGSGSEARVGVNAEMLIDDYTLDWDISSLCDVQVAQGMGRGLDYVWLTIDDTGNVGEFVAENGTASKDDPRTEQPKVEIGRVTSKIVEYSVNIIEDSLFEFGMAIERVVTRRMVRLVNSEVVKNATSLTTNSKVTPLPANTTQAVGAGTQVDNATISIFTAANSTSQVTAVKEGSLRKMREGMKPEKYAMAYWITSQANWDGIELLENTNGDRIVQPNIYDGSMARLMGRPFFRSDDVADFAADAHSIFLIDPMQLKIRWARDITISRYMAESGYDSKNMIGILGQGRVGAAFVGPIWCGVIFKNAAS